MYEAIRALEQVGVLSWVNRPPGLFGNPVQRRCAEPGRRRAAPGPKRLEALPARGRSNRENRSAPQPDATTLRVAASPAALRRRSPRSALARLAGKIAPERMPAPKGMRVGPMTTQIVVSGPHCDGATHPAPIRRVTGFRVLKPPPHHFRAPMVKREPQIILKTDERKIHLELTLGGKFAAKSTGWDKNRVFLEGDKLDVAVVNGRWVLTHLPAAHRPPIMVRHYFPDD